MRQRRRAFVGGLSTALALAFGAGLPASAQEEAAARGALLFRAHCASCHGADGSGGGPAAEALRTRPPDLTRLAAPGGEFPVERVRQTIDGRETPLAHGSREMPVWGLALSDRSRVADGDGEEVAARIDALVAHLESLQRESP